MSSRESRLDRWDIRGSRAVPNPRVANATSHHAVNLSVFARVPRDIDSGVVAVLRQLGVGVESDCVVRRGYPASIRSERTTDSWLQRLRELSRRDVVERVPLEEPSRLQDACID